MFAGELGHGILEALAYSDVFEYPLHLEELHRYLPVRADVEELQAALESASNLIQSTEGYYFLAGRAGIVEIRKRREERSRKLLPRALKYGHILGSLPFVRMAALTGSLAVMNVSEDADFDYMLVAAQGRVWTARAFALAFNRCVRTFGHAVCPNLIVSDSALEWPRRDLYSARELCQMIPITGMDVYRRLMKANEWVKEFLPNAFHASEANVGESAAKTRHREHGERRVLQSFSMRSAANTPFRSKANHQSARNPFLRAIQSHVEFLLRGRVGDRLESWEMTRKIARFSRQEGFGEETVFTAEVCQGNFHHHRKRTHEAFQNRLESLSRQLETGKGRIGEFMRFAVEK